MATTILNTARVPSDPSIRAEDFEQRELPIEEVRAEAYRLFIDRGAEDGHDVEDWLAAEELVRQRLVEPAQG